MATATEAYWEGIWRDLKPGEKFDKMVSAPVLATLPFYPSLPEGESLTALVPGCGRGYDVHLLASHPRFSQVTGVEISPSAVSAAREFLAAREGVSKDGYTVVEGDFFDRAIAPGPFDVAFDYTFFCAIPPERRAECAAAYAARMPRDAVLATLMFPVGKPESTGGPPFGVTEEDYKKAFEPAGFQCVEGPHVLPDKLAAQGRGEGKSAWAIWRRL